MSNATPTIATPTPTAHPDDMTPLDIATGGRLTLNDELTAMLRKLLALPLDRLSNTQLDALGSAIVAVNDASDKLASCTTLIERSVARQNTALYGLLPSTR